MLVNFPLLVDVASFLSHISTRAASSCSATGGDSRQCAGITALREAGVWKLLLLWAVRCFVREINMHLISYGAYTDNRNSQKFPTLFCACNHAQQLLTRAYLWQFRGVRVTSEEPELHKQASLQVSVVPCLSERCRLGCAISPAMSFDCPQTMKKFPRNPTLTNDWQGQAVRSR